MEGEVLVKFVGDTSNLDSKTKGLTSSFGKMTGSIALGNLAAKGISKGFELVSQNMDRAIQRIDTMNNYPKVMELFGVSADEASESIKRIDASVQGLPTSLDQAVAGVQDLFTVTGDLSQSEDMFKAINDSAMVFANGSTEAVDRFIYGYKQALSAGKVSAQDFNQMNEAIPGLMSKVAESMGISYKELKDGLSDGSISIDQFNDALHKLDTDGTGSMEALSKSAHTATGGIQTSIANAKTALARGVANIIKSVDKALEPFGGLSGVISSIGKIGESAFKKIGDVINWVIPKFIEVAQWINKNKAWIEPLTIAVLSFITAFKGIKTVISIVKGIQTAFALLNATMMANPIGLIIAAIAALVAVFIYLWKHCEGFRNFFIGMGEGIISGVQAVWTFLQTVFQEIVGAVTTFIQTIWAFISPIFDFIKNVLYLIIAVVAKVLETIYNILIGVAGWVWDNVLNPIVSFFTTAFDFVTGIVGNAVNFITGVFSGIANWIWNNVLSPVVNFFTSAFNTVRNVVVSVFNAIRDTISNIFNAIGNIIKAPINGIISGINGVLKTMNKIKIPKWVPGVGGKGINIPLIPKLATGTNYVPNDMIAMIHEGEAVVPKKFNPYANGMDSTRISSMQNTYNPNIQVYNNVNIEQDPLGQLVHNIKTYSGGSPNDYNYGVGVS